MVDASVFVHALLKPSPKHNPKTRAIKEHSKEIVKRIYQGEKVALSVIQMSEIASIVEKYLPKSVSLDIEEFLILSPHIQLYTPDDVLLKEAVVLTRQYQNNGVGLSDCLAYITMIENGLTEIYSFDRHFDLFKGIKRITV